MGAVGCGAQVTGVRPGMHGSTFGGNPLCCAAAVAAIETIESEDLLNRAEQAGDYLRSRLSSLRHAMIRDVRGLGLMIGVDCATPAGPIAAGMMSRGVLAMTAGNSVLRLVPPLVIDSSDLDLVVTVLEQTLLDLVLNE